MEDEQIKKIVETTIAETRKSRVPKIFHDPEKANDAFGWLLIGVLMFFIVGIALGFAVFSDTPERSIEPIVSVMECEQLKELFASEKLSATFKETIQQYAVINCI